MCLLVLIWFRSDFVILAFFHNTSDVVKRYTSTTESKKVKRSVLKRWKSNKFWVRDFVQFIFLYFADLITRLARLTSAGSRKFCLRLLGCQPGCTQRRLDSCHVNFSTNQIALFFTPLGWDFCPENLHRTEKTSKNIHKYSYICIK